MKKRTSIHRNERKALKRENSLSPRVFKSLSIAYSGDIFNYIKA